MDFNQGGNQHSEEGGGGGASMFGNDEPIKVPTHEMRMEAERDRRRRWRERALHDPFSDVYKRNNRIGPYAVEYKDDPWAAAEGGDAEAVNGVEEVADGAADGADEAAKVAASISWLRGATGLDRRRVGGSGGGFIGGGGKRKTKRKRKKGRKTKRKRKKRRKLKRKRKKTRMKSRNKKRKSHKKRKTRRKHTMTGGLNKCNAPHIENGDEFCRYHAGRSTENNEFIICDTNTGKCVKPPPPRDLAYIYELDEI